MRLSAAGPRTWAEVGADGVVCRTVTRLLRSQHMVRIGSGRTQPYVDNSNRVLAAPNRQNTLRPPEPMSAPDILPSSRYITVDIRRRFARSVSDGARRDGRCSPVESAREVD